MYVMFVNNQVKSILELSLQITPNGFSVVNNAGIGCRKRINIYMGGQGSPNKKYQKQMSRVR